MDEIDYYLNQLTINNIALPSRTCPLSELSSSCLVELIFTSLILGLKVAIDRKQVKNNEKKYLTCEHIPVIFYELLIDTYSSYLMYYMYNETFQPREDLNQLRGLTSKCVQILLKTQPRPFDENDESDLEEVLEKLFFSNGLFYFFASDQKLSKLKIENDNKFRRWY